MSQARPFSKLQKQIENLFVPELKMQVRCFSYPIRSQYGSSSIPRFVVKLGKEIIWDFPKDFPIKEINYRFWKDFTGISDLIREYIDTPVTLLLRKKFKHEEVGMIHQYLGLNEQDYYEFKLDLVNLFRASDRRLGKERLLQWAQKKNDSRVNLILMKRFGLSNNISK